MHRPLTPGKKERKEQEEIQELVSNKVVESAAVLNESDQNKIKDYYYYISHIATDQIKQICYKITITTAKVETPCSGPVLPLVGC